MSSSDGAPLARPVSCCLGFVYILLTSGKTFTKRGIHGQQAHRQLPQQGIGAAASGQKRGRQDDSSGGDAKDDGGDDDGGDDDGGEARGGDAAMEGGEASGGSVATTGEDEASGGSMATTGDDGGDGGDGGAAAAPKKKKKRSPARSKRGNGSGNQRDVRHRAATDDSGA